MSGLSRLLLWCALLPALAGCALKRPAPPPPDDPMAHFSAMAAAAREDVRQLSEIATAYRSPSLTPEQRLQRRFQATSVPPGFGRRVDLKYSGPAAHATRVIAKLSGYHYVEDGHGSPPDLWASIDLRGQPLMVALRELGAQTGDLAEIQVYPAARVIRFQVLAAP